MVGVAFSIDLLKYTDCIMLSSGKCPTTRDNGDDGQDGGQHDKSATSKKISCDAPCKDVYAPFFLVESMHTVVEFLIDGGTTLIIRDEKETNNDGKVIKNPVYRSSVNLPWKPNTVIEKKDNLGKILTGERLVSTPYTAGFLIDKKFELSCNKILTKADVSLFRSMICCPKFLRI
ncbi:nonaspanin (TM9SF) [Artemisia annua]|uniref:Nonaspanin (TM9SF) n=1 Tax=Artemisia annua TaxID=35608 RepID=A0A2U1MRX1_ARTAN|nr:nonaspanin (TM9SF) [Artemisia annua]